EEVGHLGPGAQLELDRRRHRRAPYREGSAKLRGASVRRNSRRRIASRPAAPFIPAQRLARQPYRRASFPLSSSSDCTVSQPTSRRLGVVMDPIAAISPQKDSTLAMLLEGARREWTLEYIELG